MNLVAYPDSDSASSDETQQPPAKKRRQSHGLQPKPKPEPSTVTSASALPPLPSSFHDLYATSVRASTRDDPSLHDGRKRTVPHVEGNWPTHVYLEWHPNPAESTILNHLVTRIQARQSAASDDPARRVQSLLLSPLGAPQPLHVSLSRSLVLRTPQRDPFLETVTSCLRRSSVRPFALSFSKLKWVPNFDRSRWFLVAGLKKPKGDELNRLLVACNDAARAFGLGALYDGDEFRAAERGKEPDPSGTKGEFDARDKSDRFHVSLAWSLQAPEEEFLDPMDDEQTAILVKEKLLGLEVAIDVVKLKIGNVIHPIPLTAKVEAKEKGLFG